MSDRFKNQRAQQNFVRNLEPQTTMRRVARQTQSEQAFESMPFVDLTGVGSFHDALNLQVEIKERFRRLPSNIRSYFRNNPMALYEALDDPEQQEKLYEFGIKKRPYKRRDKKGDVNTEPSSKSPGKTSGKTPGETPGEIAK